MNGGTDGFGDSGGPMDGEPSGEDVAAEREVLRRPVPDERQARPERVRNDVAGAADVDGAVANPRVTRDVLDHLRVVVSGQEPFVLAAVGHGQPADEVGEPGIGRPLLFRVLVQVVVELPGLVADPQVVVPRAGDVVEHHEVGEQDLVHPPPGVKTVQVVLGGFRLDVVGLAGQLCARRVDALAARRQHRGDRVLREPVDLQAGMELAQLVGDRHVALRVAQAAS